MSSSRKEENVCAPNAPIVYGIIFFMLGMFVAQLKLDLSLYSRVGVIQMQHHLHRRRDVIDRCLEG